MATEEPKNAELIEIDANERLSSIKDEDAPSTIADQSADDDDRIDAMEFAPTPREQTVTNGTKLDTPPLSRPRRMKQKRKTVSIAPDEHDVNGEIPSKSVKRGSGGKKVAATFQTSTRSLRSRAPRTDEQEQEQEEKRRRVIEALKSDAEDDEM